MAFKAQQEVAGEFVIEPLNPRVLGKVNELHTVNILASTSKSLKATTTTSLVQWPPMGKAGVSNFFVGKDIESLILNYTLCRTLENYGSLGFLELGHSSGLHPDKHTESAPTAEQSTCWRFLSCSRT